MSKQGRHMKRWHVEQILYLNKFNKSKLVVPEAHNFHFHSRDAENKKRESALLNSLRRFYAFFVNAL